MRRLVLLVVAIAALGGGVAQALAQTLEGRLKQISESKVVRLAHRSDSSPFSFVNAKGQPDGYTIDLCKFVVHSLEVQLNTKLTISWVPVTTQTRFEAVAGGKADMECGSSTVTFDRMTKTDFSSVTFMENTGLLVQANSGVSGIGDLAGKKIAAIAGTTNAVALKKELERRKLEATVVEVRDRQEGMAQLQSGAVDGFASDKLLLIGARNAAGSIYRMLPENLSYEPYAIALPHDDWAFRLAVNRGLSELYSRPDILDIYLKWFSALGPQPDLMRAAVYIFGTFPD
jgi:glutamate/aspartate transport system substrate-binding protein